jgi:hypothetical protein
MIGDCRTGEVIGVALLDLRERMEAIDVFGRGVLSTDALRVKRALMEDAADMPLELLGGTTLTEKGSGDRSIPGGGGTSRKKSSRLSSSLRGFAFGVSTISSSSSSSESMAYGSRTRRCLRTGPAGAFDRFEDSRSGAREFIEERRESACVEAVKVLAAELGSLSIWAVSSN